MNISLFKPNELIAAIDQIQVNRIAKHLCNYFLQYAQYKLRNDPNQGHQFELPISELNAEAQLGLKDYKLIDKSIKALMQPVTIRPKDNPKCITHLVPIYLVTMDMEHGLYKFSLAPEVLDIVKNTDYFTKLNLHEFNLLESKHSLVLYEWLKRYETAPQIPVLTVEELRNITHTADKKSYDNFTDVKRFILDVAVKEISEKTPYTVTYETIKTRMKFKAKVTAVKFTMTKKKSAEQLAGASGIVSKDIISVQGRYETLCELYVKYNFCSDPKDFYLATYKVEYKLLLDFFNQKKDKYKQQKDKLKWLLNDINNPESTRNPRRANQTDYYKSLFDKEENREIQGIIEQSRSKQGFLVQVLKLQERHNDNKKIDIDIWM